MNFPGEQLQETPNLWLAALNEILVSLRENPEQFSQLSRLLDEKWENRMRDTISHHTPDNQQFGEDQGWHLIYALSDPEGAGLGYLGLKCVESRLQHIVDVAKNQNKLASLKSTRKELISEQANQVHSALFEISILTALLHIDRETRLFPKVGDSGQNVEAAVSISERRIYCECKIRGYSTHDDVQGTAGHVRRAKLMVINTLGTKCAPGGQLAQVSKDHPTILFTCVGLDRMTEQYAREMEKELSSTRCSLVVVFGRYHCKDFRTFRNHSSPNPLTDTEVYAVEEGLELYLRSENRNDSF